MNRFKNKDFADMRKNNTAQDLRRKLENQRLVSIVLLASLIFTIIWVSI